jgi:hypothetical protein
LVLFQDSSYFKDKLGDGKRGSTRYRRGKLKITSLSPTDPAATTPRGARGAKAERAGISTDEKSRASF